MENFTGIIGILFLVSVITYLIKTTSEFSFNKHTVSYLGTIPKTKNILMASFLVYSFLRLIFFITLFARLNLWNNYVIIPSFVIAFNSFFIATFFSLSVYEKIHTISAMISWIFTVILIFSIGIIFLKTSLFLGIANIFLAGNMLLGCLMVKLKKGENSYFQLYFIINLIIWDIVIMFFLLGLIK